VHTQLNFSCSRWEIPLDDVILNGQKLPKPDLSSGYTALIDSVSISESSEAKLTRRLLQGTSFLAGPNDLVSSIYTTISGSSASTSSSNDGPPIPCNVPVHLSFVIGGKEFPVDPRDFLSAQDNANDCTAGSILPTDAPGPGALMSWILGDPFMKS